MDTTPQLLGGRWKWIDETGKYHVFKYKYTAWFTFWVYYIILSYILIKEKNNV